jgi:hypothetical protein
MKKFICLTGIISVPFAVMAQANPPANVRSIFDVCATIFLAGITMVFLLAALKSILNYYLKVKILEKGIPENVAVSLLQANSNEDRSNTLKWFIILAGTGLGLTIVNYTQPLDIHSLAIMASCISLSFLCYYYFVVRKARK